MAGQVGQIVEVVNRTTKVLILTFDGRSYDLVPGYRLAEDGTVLGAGPHGDVAVTHLDYLKAEMAKRQNVKWGTEDPMNPQTVEHLVVIPSDGDDISYTEQNDTVKERFDRGYFADPKVRHPEVIAGAGFPGRRAGRSVAPGPTYYQDGLSVSGRVAGGT